MATIYKIVLPNGDEYDLGGGGSGDIELRSSYDSNTKTVTIYGGTVDDADNTEY